MRQDEERLMALEIRSAEQEAAIEDLSKALTEQWKAIETLQARLDALARRFVELEEQSQGETPVTRPPHW